MYTKQLYNMFTTINPEDFSGKSTYLKLQDNTPTRIRILGDEFICKRYFNNQGKPVYLPYATKETPDDRGVSTYDNKPSELKVVVIMTILDRTDDQVKVWEVTQGTIINKLIKFDQDPDWGALPGYDIVVIKEKKDRVSYDLSCKPKADPNSPTEQRVLDAMAEAKEVFELSNVLVTQNVLKS